MVELRVRDQGSEILVYALQSVAEAAEMMHFLGDFLPSAQFTVQPLTH